jgi:cobalamin-dependent methionine synthase I
MIIIGEKINGSIPSMGKAIAAKDEEYIRNMAKKQAEAGCDFIDVCASVPPEVEYDTLKWMLDLVQDAVDTPLSVDSPNPDARTDASLCQKARPDQFRFDGRQKGRYRISRDCQHKMGMRSAFVRRYGNSADGRETPSGF